MKAARTVWSGGKAGDHIKSLPIAIVSYCGYAASHEPFCNVTEKFDLYRNYPSKEDIGYSRNEKGTYLCGKKCDSNETQYIAKGTTERRN